MQPSFDGLLWNCATSPHPLKLWRNLSHGMNFCTQLGNPASHRIECQNDCHCLACWWFVTIATPIHQMSQHQKICQVAAMIPVVALKCHTLLSKTWEELKKDNVTLNDNLFVLIANELEGKISLTHFLCEKSGNTNICATPLRLETCHSVVQLVFMAKNETCNSKEWLKAGGHFVFTKPPTMIAIF